MIVQRLFHTVGKKGLMEKPLTLISKSLTVLDSEALRGKAAV